MHDHLLLSDNLRASISFDLTSADPLETAAAHMGGIEEQHTLASGLSDCHLVISETEMSWILSRRSMFGFSVASSHVKLLLDRDPCIGGIASTQA